MSADYHPPSVDDAILPDSTPHQTWLASGPGDGLARSSDAAPTPAISATHTPTASDNASQRGHMPVGDNSPPARSRPRSATVRRTPSQHVSTLPAEQQDTHQGAMSADNDDDTQAADLESSSDETIVQDALDEEFDDENLSECPASPTSNLTNFSALTGKTHGSGSSSGSGSTVTQSSWPPRRRGSDRSRQHDRSQFKLRRRSRSPRLHQPQPQYQPHRQLHQQQQPLQHHYQQQQPALAYLDRDSPNVTAEAIQRSVEQAYWKMPDAASFQSPSARSTSSTSSSFQSDVFSELDHETDRSSSPDHSAYGDSPSLPGKFVDVSQQQYRAQQHAEQQHQQQHMYQRNYGTPEMPRGNANLPHLPPNALQPRLPGMHQGHPKHLPRAEKLPLTGYELIASKLCAGDADRSSIKPIYRRFEALNHRLLLHLQDELAELEEQLHRLDTADTQTRRMQNCILPASRRQEALTAGELQWHKTDVLGKIGYKLGQYSEPPLVKPFSSLWKLPNITADHVLASFKDTQHLPAPEQRDIDYYRAYLANHNPIVEIETRFLDPVDDLVSLARPPSSRGAEDELRTPMPRKPQKQHFLLTGTKSERARRVLAFLINSYALHVALAFAAAFLLPILTFAVIPGYLGRMAVVLLVAVGVALAVVQAGLFGAGKDRTASQAATEGLLVSGIYVGVMAVVAGIFGRSL
ncbi:hypothetical protein CSOJ01_07459 [Colletotrichum sojae]|uniref:DUF6594 domain-containing protein n=1 Tax=Colletotrichum sojae TaxID=2175907 RepID=A0A8H6J8P4_9PEZI|nr:hypothetical protein CSOJ01_07459 [Colletotrichum sojae]